MGRPKDGRVYHERITAKDGDRAYKRGDTHADLASKNEGLNPRGWEFWHETDCPCSICGHSLQKECYEAGCDCCSSYCT